ncbi:MAG TPA: pilus assembly PilX N-terminal domain-containing protein [Mycobacteriales bacterium]|nr:pilus assembly PilX N-terminal domain-containing protein [Mycobacteriales bacterium]
MSTSWITRLRARLTDDSGVALVVVIMFVIAIGVVGTTAAVVGTAGLRNSAHDRAAGGAQATSDAGVAEAISYIRANGLGALTCAEAVTSDLPTGWTQTSDPCSTNISWANDGSPQTVSTGGGTTCSGSTACYRVWIGTLQTYVPGAQPVPELLRVHSTGFFGTGPGARSVDVDLSVNPADFPLGIYADSVGTNGNSSFDSVSLFVPGNVQIKCPPTGVDPAYNLPAAVHAAGTITYGPGNKCVKPAGSAHPPACNTARPFDQDGNGGPLTSGDGCYQQGAVQYPGTDPSYPTTSYFSANDLANYGYVPGGLTPSEYEALKAEAQAEGTYFTSTSTSSLNGALTTLQGQGVHFPVVYYDFPSCSNCSLPWVAFNESKDIPSVYTREPSDSSNCDAWGLIIVVRYGNMSFDSGGDLTPLVASIFVPEGTFSGTNNFSQIGTLFVKNLDVTGTQTHELDECFSDNPPGGLLNVTTTNYRAVDTQNLQ